MMFYIIKEFKRRSTENSSIHRRKKFDLSWCLYSFDEWIVKSRKDPRIIREETIVEATSLEGTIDTLSSSVVHKILCICNPDRILEIEEDLNQQFPQFSIVKSSPILLEIMQSGITKATAIREFCKIENYSLDDAVAFGDNYNDVEMLNEVHYGFLMGNAPNELKKDSRYIPLIIIIMVLQRL